MISVTPASLDDVPEFFLSSRRVYTVISLLPSALHSSSMRRIFLFALATTACALVASPFHRGGCRAPLCSSPAMLSDVTATASPVAAATPTASVKPSIWRRAIGLPVTVPRAIWRRCTDELCDVGRPRPLQLIRNLIPKKRPLATIAGAESSSGIYKVERREGARVMVLYPFPTQQRAMSTEDAMDMF